MKETIFLPFTDIFEDVTKYGTKIPTIQYLKQGKYPIIDQGKAYIAGYTNQERGLFCDVPIIIFGDHTRILKFVDTPFFLGADGVKVIKPKLQCNVKYLYYVLQTQNIPDTGYNRHFKWLKSAILPILDSSRQEEVVQQLEKIEYLITKRKQQMQKLNELVKSQFIEMFGSMPLETTLSYYISELRAGKSVAGVDPCINKVLKTGAATFGYFDESQVKNLPIDYIPNPLHLVESGDVIISRMNTPELVGTCSYVWKAPKNTYYPDRLWKTVVKQGVSAIFLWQLMQQPSVRKQIKENASGTSGSMWNISKPNLLRIAVAKVSPQAQNEFANFVEQTDKSKNVYGLGVAA